MSTNSAPLPIFGAPARGTQAPTQAGPALGQTASATAMGWEAALGRAEAAPQSAAGAITAKAAPRGGDREAHAGASDDLSVLLAAYALPPAAALALPSARFGNPAQGPAGRSAWSMDSAAQAPVSALLSQDLPPAPALLGAAAAPVQANPLASPSVSLHAPLPAIPGGSGARPQPVDLLARPAPQLDAALRLAAAQDTLHSTPWLGLSDSPETVVEAAGPQTGTPSSAPSAPGTSAASAALRLATPAAQAAPAALLSVRDAVANALPERVAGLPEQLQDQAALPLARTESQAATAPKAATAAPLQRSTPADTLRAAAVAADGTADGAAANSDADSAALEATQRPGPSTRAAFIAGRAAPLAADTAPAGQGAAAHGQVADPGSTVGLRAAAAPHATAQLAADGRFTDGKLPQQAGVTLPQKLEIDVHDGEHALKVTLAREADGLVVEVRSPREAVAQLRALEPEVDAALTDSGYDLNSYDAQEHSESQGAKADGQSSGQRAVAVSSGAAAATETRAPVVSPDGQGRLLSREA